MELILASQSPRRKDILGRLDIPFTILPADIDESVKKDERPMTYVERLSIEKAGKIADVHKDAVVIGSDLTVDLDGQSIGKAGSDEEAMKILQSFMGRSHYTRCGYAVFAGGALFSAGVVSTKITFKDVNLREIAEYVESGAYKGLAGAYGVQGAAAKFVQEFKGSYYDILGFPIYEITSILAKLGFNIKEKNVSEIIKEDKEKVFSLNS